MRTEAEISFDDLELTTPTGDTLPILVSGFAYAVDGDVVSVTLGHLELAWQRGTPTTEDQHLFRMVVRSLMKSTHYADLVNDTAPIEEPYERYAHAEHVRF